MSNPILTVDGIGKAFRSYGHEFRRILSWFNIGGSDPNETWVLSDINFSIGPGEAVGIVGRNGAGKSTLLKMIAGTLRPSSGQVHVDGRISAILELGMGFNPEMTGRRNVYSAAGMMGFDRAAIDGVLDGIIEFCELGSYFDEPIRVYSSGMQMRLAFAIATAFRPDILIIDEALAVGDSYFQHKSNKRIREFRDAGTSLILVSHEKAALLSLCDRALLLHEGQLMHDGTPEAVFDLYNALISGADPETIETRPIADGRLQIQSGSGEATFSSIQLVDESGAEIDTAAIGQSITLKVEINVLQDIDVLVLGFSIKDRLGVVLYGSNTHYLGGGAENIKAGEALQIDVTFPVHFAEGSYSISLALAGGEDHLGESYSWRDLALLFDVINLDRTAFDGKFYLEPSITSKRVSATDTR